MAHLDLAGEGDGVDGPGQDALRQALQGRGVLGQPPLVEQQLRQARPPPAQRRGHFFVPLAVVHDADSGPFEGKGLEGARTSAVVWGEAVAGVGTQAQRGQRRCGLGPAAHDVDPLQTLDQVARAARALGLARRAATPTPVCSTT